MKYRIIFVTAPKGREAERLARMLVKERLCACVNIIPGLVSFFWWQGKIDTAKESLLIAKTEERLVKKLTAAVRRAHSYSVCEVVALSVVAGNAPYLAWITASLKKGKKA